MSAYHQPLLPDHIYHLFSRAVGNEKLFLTSENYIFFLSKLKQHTSAVCSIYCYSLLPNHFHLVVRINQEEIIIKHFEEIKKRAYHPINDKISDFIMERFSNFLNSYTKSFNKVNNRKGGLFMDYMKRSLAESNEDFITFVWYVHKNAVHHNLRKNIGEWPYDSYNSILSDLPTLLLRKEAIGLFGSKADFVKFHQQAVHPKVNLNMADL